MILIMTMKIMIVIVIMIMMIIIIMMTQMMMMIIPMTCSAHPAPSIRRVNNQGLALHLAVQGWKTNGRMATVFLL